MSVTGSEYTDITAVASTGLTSNQFYFVKSTAADSTYSAGNLTCLLAHCRRGDAGRPISYRTAWHPASASAATAARSDLGKTTSGASLRGCPHGRQGFSSPGGAHAARGPRTLALTLCFPGH